MERHFQSIEDLRQIQTDLAGKSYSVRFAKQSGFSKTQWRYHWSDTGRVYVEQPIEVGKTKQGQIVYRAAKVLQKEEHPTEQWFDTSIGRLYAQNHGEFGGFLITPHGTLEGNFIEVCEAGGSVYAIDYLNHLLTRRTRTYALYADRPAVKLYDTDEVYIELGAEPTAICAHRDILYILLTGHIDRSWNAVSFLLELEKGNVRRCLRFDTNLGEVCNMLINDGKAILGRDKVITMINLETQRITHLTPLEASAEQDLLSGKREWE